MTAASAMARASVPGEPRYLGRVLLFLELARDPAWLIAAVVVVADQRPEVNLRHEPLLLVLTLAHIGAGAAYLALLRPRVRSAFGLREGSRRDLGVLAAIDMAVIFAVLYASGGFDSPYYHLANVTLLTPTFLVGWVGSALLLIGFIAGLLATWSLAGLGTDGRWTQSGASDVLAGVLLTPVLIVLVAQYTAWLSRQIDERRHQANRALAETSALHSAARAFTRADEADPLVAEVVRILAATGRFGRLAARRVNGAAAHTIADWASDGGAGSTTVRAGGAHADDGLSTVPIAVEGERWGVLAFAPAVTASVADDTRLVEAVAEQLSVGLARIALIEEKESLAALEERSRIGREIHDGIAQSIYMLSLHLEKAADTARDDPALRARLGGLVDAAKQTLIEVRHYIFDLKPLLTGDATLAATVRAQAKEFTTVPGLPVELEVAGDEPRIPIAVSSALYRITQEALANAFRHAGAASVRVRLSFEPRSILLEVQDDGAGFEPATVVPGHGLRNMRERAEELSGRLELHSEVGRGTAVRVTIPLAGDSATARGAE